MTRPRTRCVTWLALTAVLLMACSGSSSTSAEPAADIAEEAADAQEDVSPGSPGDAEPDGKDPGDVSPELEIDSDGADADGAGSDGAEAAEAAPDADSWLATEPDIGPDTGPDEPLLPQDLRRVVFASGELQAANGCWFAGDAESDATGCVLISATWDVANHIPVGFTTLVEDTKDGHGVWQPNVTPDGEWLTFAHRTFIGVKARYRPVGGTAGALGFEADLPQAEAPFHVWPALSSDGDLVVSTPSTHMTCVVDDDCKTIDRTSLSYHLAAVTTEAQPATLVVPSEGFAFEDPAFHPSAPNLVAGHGRYDGKNPDAEATCPGDDPSAGTPCQDMNLSPMPIVVDRLTDTFWILELQAEVDGETLALEGCAHLAWSPDGERLLCTEQGTPAFISQGLQSRLFVFDFEPGAWSDDGTTTVDAELLFSHRTADELFEIGDGEACDVFHHKYAQWCGSDALVATIACGCQTAGCQADAVGETLLLADRVYLIDISDPAAPVYDDLTAAYEGWIDAPAGTRSGFTATCLP